MNQNEFEPRMYIVMREDLWDMNPGKGMAQAAHAQADFDAYIYRALADDPECVEAFKNWCKDRNFGVTLVLSAPKTEWMDISLSAQHYGYVVDPSYPWRNYYGKTFTTEEDTCMWVFAITEEEIEHMKQFPLHS